MRTYVVVAAAGAALFIGWVASRASLLIAATVLAVAGLGLLVIEDWLARNGQRERVVRSVTSAAAAPGPQEAAAIANTDQDGLH